MAAEEREAPLLQAAAAFAILYGAVLTLSPAAREHGWNVTYRWSHWPGLFLAIAAFYAVHRLVSRRLPSRDQYLLPIAAILSGWGVLTLWRLNPAFGLRQNIWLVVSLIVMIPIAGHTASLDVLRRHKYLLLGAGLLLTSLTLILGTNPAGAGPRLWLGCCGVYLQPSEPLKLLLVAYLAAYLADQVHIPGRFFPLLLPTVLLTSVALILLLVQRDLGTASLFILLYAVMLYLATDRQRVLLATAVALILASLIGFVLIDVVHARLEAWLAPWNDPSGLSYQIIQSLLAIANGGVFGRGPGLGSPGLVPVAHADFIFSALAEETGIVGTLGLLAAYAILLARGLIIAVRASTRYYRLLAAGLTSYLATQALLIIGGNLRLLPLTGVTLPFVSYGGSSLLTSFAAAGLLLAISSRSTRHTTPLPAPRPYYVLSASLAMGIVAAALLQAWWAIIRAPALLSRTDNPRRAIADRYVRRGSLLDRNDQEISATIGTSGTFKRVYLYPDLSPVIGYTHPTYGQAGLEATLDEYLRGIQANPTLLIWWDQLLYGTPPPGLDVRLSLDMGVQKKADDLLGDLTGAVVLLDARSGEILAMASHPTFDANQMSIVGEALARDKTAPLLNRAGQGSYAAAAATVPFLDAAGVDQNEHAATANVYQRLGLFAPPQLRLPVGPAAAIDRPEALHTSPLQMAIAAATLSNGGVLPGPRIALAVKTPRQGWIVLPAEQESKPVFDRAGADNGALRLAAAGQTYWQWLVVEESGSQYVSWYVAGTLPNWQGTPLSLAVLIEGNDPRSARQIGQQLLNSAIRP